MDIADIYSSSSSSSSKSSSSKSCKEWVQIDEIRMIHKERRVTTNAIRETSGGWRIKRQYDPIENEIITIENLRIIELCLLHVPICDPPIRAAI